MRILYVIDKMKNFAGMERILSCKLNYLSTHTSYELYITTYEQGNTALPFSLNERVNYKPINTKTEVQYNSSFIDWILRFFVYRQNIDKCFSRLVDELSPDIIIGTGYSFPILDILIKISKRHNAKFIIESHTMAETVLLSHKCKYNKLVYKIATLIDNYILKSLRCVDRVVTLTKKDASFWKRYTDKISVIPNMLTIEPILVQDYDSKIVISAGRYSYEKGYDILIKAWKIVSEKYPSWNLWIVGNGNRDEYEKLVRELGLSKTVCCLPATDDIQDLYSKASIYVMSSRYEGFGLVLTEAMSCGLPCVSFNCPYGPAEIIKDKEDGFLVEDGDILGLASSIETLMDDRLLRQEMGDKASKNILRYSIDAIMKQWIELFESI